MLIIGVDPGAAKFTITELTILPLPPGEGRVRESVWADNYYTIHNLIPPKKIKGLQRLSWFDQQFTDLFLYSKYGECPVFMENYAYSGYATALIPIAEITGIFKLILITYQCRLYTIPPTSLKKFVTGKGNSHKDLMLKEICKRWKVDFNNIDEAESYAIARMGEAYLNPSADLPKFQQEAITNIIQL